MQFELWYDEPSVFGPLEEPNYFVGIHLLQFRSFVEARLRGRQSFGDRSEERVEQVCGKRVDSLDLESYRSVL